MMYADKLAPTGSLDSRSSAPSDGSTSYMSENSDHSGKSKRHRPNSTLSSSSISSHSEVGMYGLKKEKQSIQNHHVSKQNGARPNKKRGHSVKSHSTHNSSRNDDEVEIEDHHGHPRQHHGSHQSHHSHKSHKSNHSHSLKQSRTSNTKHSHSSIMTDDNKSQKSNKRKQKYSHGSHHSHHSGSNHSHRSHEKKDATNESKKSKPKLKPSKMDEFTKNNRQFLRLTQDDDARSMLSEQSVEYLGRVEDNEISIKAVPKKGFKKNKIDEEYIDENHSDSRENDYEYWKPQNQRQGSAHSLGSNSLNSLTNDTGSKLQKAGSGSPHSHSDSQSHSSSHSRSHSHSMSSHDDRGSDDTRRVHTYGDRSITELTGSDYSHNNADAMGIEMMNQNESNMEVIQSMSVHSSKNNNNNPMHKSKNKLKLRNNASDLTAQTSESSVVSPLSDGRNVHQMYHASGQKPRYNGHMIYNHHTKSHMMSQPMDRVSIRSHATKTSRSRRHHHHDDGDTLSLVSGQSEAASLNSISTSHTDATSRYQGTHGHKPMLKSNQLSGASSQRALEQVNKREYDQMQLSKKIQQQIALQKEYQENQHIPHEAMDTADTESYMSNVYTDDTRSVYTYTEDQTHSRRHKSMDTVTTRDYEPSIFTDIDYDIDYNNVGIKDIVWTQKLKYLKNRLIFLEKEIVDLPSQNKRLDKLMLYVALEFLSVNPDEKKANDRLVEWWDLHKYSWLDKHDPQKEDTLLSQNWNEIGIPLTRDPGSTPTHHKKTIFEDIYDNLKRTEWTDPFSVQHSQIGRSQSNESKQHQDEDDINDDTKSVIPSTIVFSKSRYKDYDEPNTRSYLIDANDFLSFLHRQTTGNLVRSKSGLVGYVNVSVEDKVAECTPWRLHRIFQTCAWNRANAEQNRKLMSKNDQLARSTDTKSDQIEAYRIEISQLKNELLEQQARLSQMREQYERQMESMYRQQHGGRPSSARSSKRGNSANGKRSKQNKQFLGYKSNNRHSNNSHESHEIIDMSPSSGHSQLFDPNHHISRSVPPTQEDNEMKDQPSYLHGSSPSRSPQYDDHQQYHQSQVPRQRSRDTHHSSRQKPSRNSNNGVPHEAPRFSPMMQSKSHHSTSHHNQHQRHFTQPQQNRANRKDIVIYTGNDRQNPRHHQHFNIKQYDDQSMYSADYEEDERPLEHHSDGSHEQTDPHYAQGYYNNAPPQENAKLYKTSSAKRLAMAQNNEYAQDRRPPLYNKRSGNEPQYDYAYDHDREPERDREPNHYDDARYQTPNKSSKRGKRSNKTSKRGLSKSASPSKQLKVKTKIKSKSKSKGKVIDSKPSPVPQQMTLNSKQRRDMAINRSKRALATWKLYVDRYEIIAKRYPTQIADRNKAWLQWTKMLDEREKNPKKALTESQLWAYIDFARMSIARYANWIWWPERPDLIQLNPQKIKTINKAKKSKSASKGSMKEDDNRTYINDKQYYDHSINLIFTKKFAIVMDFNLFLFETYANPANIQETLAYEHSLLSLASSTNVVISKKNPKDFYLNTSGKNEYRYLQFRCDGKDAADDEMQRNEWMEELDYQIHIVHDLLSIPNIKLKIADPNATVWLPTPCIPNKTKPSTPSTQKTGQV